MPRRFLIASGKVGPLFDEPEERARARYLKQRLVRGTEKGRTALVVSDFGLYGGAKGSAGLRAAADAALAVEIEGSIEP